MQRMEQIVITALEFKRLSAEQMLFCFFYNPTFVLQGVYIQPPGLYKRLLIRPLGIGVR